MSISLPQSLILKSFIVGDLYPSSLRTTIDQLISEGVLIERDPKVKRVESSKPWSIFSSLIFGKKHEKQEEKDRVLICRSALDNFVEEFLNWANDSYQGLMTYS